MAKNPKYISPLINFAFRKIFRNEDIMIAFLNDLLEPESPVKRIIYLDMEALGIITYERFILYDLRCICDNGSEMIVEIRDSYLFDFSESITRYLSGNLSPQTEKRDTLWDYEHTPVYGIFLFNFMFLGYKPMAIILFQMKANDKGDVFSEPLKTHFLEMPDNRKRLMSDCHENIDYWLYNLANMSSMTTELPFQVQRPIFKKMGYVSEWGNMTEEESETYMWYLDSYCTNIEVIKGARQEGFEEGFEEGLAEARAKKKAQQQTSKEKC